MYPLKTFSGKKGSKAVQVYKTVQVYSSKTSEDVAIPLLAARTAAS